jgi:hypothetical protein
MSGYLNPSSLHEFLLRTLNESARTWFIWTGECSINLNLVCPERAEVANAEPSRHMSFIKMFVSVSCSFWWSVIWFCECVFQWWFLCSQYSMSRWVVMWWCSDVYWYAYMYSKDELWFELFVFCGETWYNDCITIQLFSCYPVQRKERRISSFFLAFADNQIVRSVDATNWLSASVPHSVVWCPDPPARSVGAGLDPF